MSFLKSGVTAGVGVKTLEAGAIQTPHISVLKCRTKVIKSRSTK